MRPSFTRGCPKFKSLRSQAGQALIYGLFMLTASLAALFFLFNVGQLTHEKTRLVNTSDAVAYSAGIMHARAMNFAAYTNRAMIANDLAIAQSVSLASWGSYLAEHGQSALALGCNPESGYGAFSEPAAEAMLRYLPVCLTLGYSTHFGALEFVNDATHYVGSAAAIAAELSREVLQTSQSVLKTSQNVMAMVLPMARLSVMQDVAEANYAGEGTIQVDEIPLLDTFYWFNGEPHNSPALNPIIQYHTGDQRARMRDLVVRVVKQDGFTVARNWSDTALIPEPSCLLLGLYSNHVDRSGGTQLIGFDEWRATDQASYFRWHLEIPKFGFPPKFGLPYCAEETQTLGTGEQRASSSGYTAPVSHHWKYSGIPSFAELSSDALKDADPRAQFAVRVLRDATQTRTSDGRADIRTTPRLNAYQNAVPTDLTTKRKVYVGLSASETYFKRPTGRADGNQEIGSLFNPYWQTHLMEVPENVRQAAQLRQGAITP